MKSFAVSPYTMPAALAAGDDILGGTQNWNGYSENKEQMLFLESFRRRASAAKDMAEIQSHATKSIPDHTSWLKERGWDAGITTGQPGDVFLASILDVISYWLEVGKTYKDGAIDRVTLKEGVTYFEESGQNPIVQVFTQGNEQLWFQQPNAKEDFGGSQTKLLAYANDVILANKSGSYAEEGVLDFPMIDLTDRREAKYMIGLMSGPNHVVQALEQFKFQLNDKCARARAAAEIGVSRGLGGPRTIRLSGPFVAAVVRPGTPDPIYVGYCAQDCWKNPGKID